MSVCSESIYPSKQDAVRRQSSDVELTKHSKDKQTDDEAKAISIHSVFADGNLRNRSAKTKDKYSNQHEHLQALKNIDDMSRCLTVDSEESLTKISQRVAIGICVHVNTPHIPTRYCGHEAENSVKGNSRTIASV